MKHFPMEACCLSRFVQLLGFDLEIKKWQYRWGGGRFCIAVFLTLAVSSFSLGQIAEQNVLVIYNDASPDGLEIAQYYQQTHPGVQLLGLTGVTTSEEVSADYYLSTIRPQILPALDSSVDVIVTTKGLPLRINVTQSNPTSYTDPFGVSRTVGNWRPYSSLESELARIDTISMWEQMGDQTYWKPLHHACNPYYYKSTSFDHETYGIRLTSRLDGFTVDDITGSIDRAQQAFLYPQTSIAQVVVVDDDPNGHYDRMSLLNDQLTARNQMAIYDTTSAAITTAQNVIGYVSHGTHSTYLQPGYIPDQLDFLLSDGAVFHTRESYNAITFAEDETQSQGLVAEWIAVGGTVGVGHVQEPINSIDNIAHEDKIFAKLLDGYTWAEAAWAATFQLSYVNTVVGDPLMTFRELIPGDATRDGIVDISDLGSMSGNYGACGEPGEVMWCCGDFDGNGVVDISDLGIIASHWGATADWYSLTAQAVPEPSALMLALVGLVTLFARPRRGS
ncbi:MAG: TIGR03790 family protein [Pirellulales bacterium]|nr:TIGR03790 family protein [Pirellulales bacterium]